MKGISFLLQSTPSYEQSQRDLTEARSKLAESSKLLDSNHQVITWLNKEINEAQLGRVSAYGTATNEKVENKVRDVEGCDLTCIPLASPFLLHRRCLSPSVCPELHA